MRGLLPVFRPKATITNGEVAAGLRWMTFEGTVSSGFGAIVGGSFLAAFALALGASAFQIGMMAAIPLLLQPLQIPAILLVERLRWRKAIVIASFLPNQLLWLPLAFIPFFLPVPGSHAVAFLLGMIALRSAMSAVTNCAWNSWTRDLIPQAVLGRFFARRMALSTLLSTGVGLLAAAFADLWLARFPDSPAMAYSLPIMMGVLTLGLAGPFCMTMMPEPQGKTLSGGARPSALTSILAAPFQDANYRRLLRFLFLWGLTINLATPFFAVYMLTRLGLPLSVIMVLTTIGQVFHILFLRVWGPFADRFGVKGVLSVSASLYLLVIFMWTFTTMPERHFLTIPLLVLLHIGSGIATAGVGLTTGTMGMKLAPKGQATAYLAAAGLASNFGSGIGPLVGGIMASFFTARELGVTFTWVDPGHSVRVPAINFTGFDFLFVMAFILGLITLEFLRGLREEGETKREVVLEALFSRARDLSRPMSTVPSMGLLNQFPYGYLSRLPIPGLDAVVGVAAYQISEVARAAGTIGGFVRLGPRTLVRVLAESPAYLRGVFWGCGYEAVDARLDTGSALDNAMAEASEVAERAAREARRSEEAAIV